MTKMIIKESELRRYIKKLVQESLENEARQSDESKAEIAKMESGQPYDRSKLEQAGLRREETYRAKMGYPSIKDWIRQQKATYKEQTGKSLGSIDVRNVGADGVPQSVAVGKERYVVPVEQMSQARDEIMGKRADAHRELNRNRWVKNADRERIAKERGVDVDQVARFDNGINNAENDPHTQMWNSLSDDEKAAYAEKIRKQRIDRSSADNEKFRVNNQTRPHGEIHDTKYYVDHLNKLYAQREKLHQELGGRRTDLNADQWDKYDYVITDTEKLASPYIHDQNVICTYFRISPEEYQSNEQMWRNAYEDEYARNQGKKTPDNQDRIWNGDAEDYDPSKTDDNLVNQIDNDAMNVANSQMTSQLGDNFINPLDAPRNLRGDKEQPQIDKDDKRNKRKKDKFDDAEEMGMFNDFDNFFNSF